MLHVAWYNLFIPDSGRRWMPVIIVSVCLVLGGTIYGISSILNIDDFLIRYAWAFVCVQTGAIALLSLSLILAKEISVCLAPSRTRRMDALRDQIAAAVVGHGDTRSISAAASIRPQEFLEVCGECFREVKGSSHVLLEELLLQSPAYPRLLRQPAHPNPNLALQAVTLLRNLEAPDARAAISAALSHPIPLVRLSARMAILSGDDRAAQMSVLRELPALPFWQKLVLFQRISLQFDFLPAFLERLFHSQKEEDVLTGLEFIFCRRRVLMILDPEHLAGAHSTEIRIKYFKAMPFFIAGQERLSILKSGLADPDWRVRAMAAKACGQLRRQELIAELLDIVRGFRTAMEAVHATRALAALGDEGRKALQELSYDVPEQVHRVIYQAIEKEILLGSLQS